MIFWARNEKIKELNNTRPIGIVNLGVTCYFNALIQNLFNIPDFTKNLVDPNTEKDNENVTNSDSGNKKKLLEEMGFNDLSNIDLSYSIEDIIETIILKNSKKDDTEDSSGILEKYYKKLNPRIDESIKQEMVWLLFSNNVLLNDLPENPDYLNIIDLIKKKNKKE